MLTQGEAEDLMGKDFSRFYIVFLGRGPKTIKVHSVDNNVLVITQNDLSNGEKLLISTKSGNIIIKDMRRSLIESGEDELKKIVTKATLENVNNFHHHFSTKNGEEILMFSLCGVPGYQLKNNKKGKYTNLVA
jgi:uncharacterized protein YbcI